MNRIAIAALIAGLALSGCAKLHSTGIAYRDPSQSRVFIWRSDYSAGIATEDGICAQGALTARASETNLDMGVSDRALALLQSPALSEQAEELVGIASRQAQTVMLTNATNGQTAFANIAYFYLCQISLNGQLSEDTIQTMWADTTRAVASIAQTGLTPASVQSPNQDTGQSDNRPQ
ncbi:hypothetical protein GCM10007420_21280 [Glycocaulis albus]|uniref:Lipoprotein n=1 Tax=Glycocaulis albus TaxID=1382801 RepID=A0ABQ1XVV5_9PROT|nr:hypothetical protein [Glycocaulis albus]GGH04553.1 hypothetical protein GCM10007420_21280 [Glycocaulis albus]